MTGLRIADVAARAGVPATTLRYYEQIGLIAASRSDNGYRSYSERDLERLAFISRAKQLDMSLGRLRDLVDVWDAEDCSTVAHSMAEAVSARLLETQTRISELVALAGQLQGAKERLAGTRAAGACSSECPCLSDMSTAGDTGTLALELAGRNGEPIPIACTLEGGKVRQRILDWQQALAGPQRREQVPDGVRLTFAYDTDRAAELGRLAAAEHACCPFFTFSLHVDATAVTFEVVAPARASEIVAAVFGTPGASDTDTTADTTAAMSDTVADLGLQPAAAGCSC